MHLSRCPRGLARQDFFGGDLFNVNLPQTLPLKEMNPHSPNSSQVSPKSNGRQSFSRSGLLAGNLHLSLMRVHLEGLELGDIFSAYSYPPGKLISSRHQQLLHL